MSLHPEVEKEIEAGPQSICDHYVEHIPVMRNESLDEFARRCVEFAVEKEREAIRKEAVSDTPYGKIITALSTLAKLPCDDDEHIRRSPVMDEVVRIRANADLMERENAALRHDIERHVKIASDLATELARAQHDLITLCLRLCMEPNDSHSPDTADVLNRWRKAWEAAAAGKPIFGAIDTAIAQGKGEK